MKSYHRNMEENRPVFIWGGAMYGEISYLVLTQLYHKNVAAVIDNKTSKMAWADIPVIRSRELAEYSGIDILVCAANAFESITKEAGKYAYRDIRLYDCRAILRDYKEARENGSISGENIYLYGSMDLDEMILKYDFYAGEKNNGYGNRIDLPYCVLCITSRCTLRCRNCAAFAAHYQNPADYSLDYVKTVFGRFLDAVDSIQELELMGGEPFLCHDFNGILRWCLGQEKIKTVKIITNGTVVPKASSWELLRNQKVKLVVDDYGTLSSKIHTIEGLSKKYGARWELQKLQTWYQLEPVSEKGYSEREKTAAYEECVFRSCIGVTNGRMYHCNVAGHMNASGLLDDGKSDFIELQNREWESSSLKERIRKFLDIPYLEACDYCNYSAHIEISVAEQIG